MLQGLKWEGETGRREQATLSCSACQACDQLVTRAVNGLCLWIFFELVFTIMLENEEQTLLGARVLSGYVLSFLALNIRPVSCFKRKKIEAHSPLPPLFPVPCL